MAQTHKSMIWQAGVERGEAVASWMEIPELGTKVWTESEGSVTVTEDNLIDIWFEFCWMAESNGRQFSPFEFTARELNAIDAGLHQYHCAYGYGDIVPAPEDGSCLPAPPYDVWEVFEAGIERGYENEYKRLKAQGAFDLD